MIKNRRNLLWAIPLALLVTSPLWRAPVTAFLKPRGGYDPNLAKLAGEIGQNFVMDKVAITLTSNGRTEWIVNAERAFTGKTDKEINMMEVKAIHFAKDQERVYINSNRGTYFINNRFLTLKENVVVRKPAAKQVMYSDLLDYYDDRKMVVSPGDVDIRGPNFSIQAGRMDYDISNDAYDLSERVHCVF
jgi:LPS export ABC transporter protein LptC